MKFFQVRAGFPQANETGFTAVLPAASPEAVVEKKKYEYESKV